MQAVGIRELKNRLSEYLRAVRRGEEVLITDRGRVIAELKPPGAPRNEATYLGLLQLVHEGRVRAGEPNTPDAYPALPRLLPEGEALKLLDEERGER